jgi:quercetin dioxygenase-like cupin family protein
VPVLRFKAVHFTNVKAEKVEESGFKGVQVRWLITKEDDAKNFAMRCFEIEPGGQSASHIHGWEHEVFILNGRCLVACGDEEKEAGPGHAIFIPLNVSHYLKNIGNKTLRFLCLIPYKER